MVGALVVAVICGLLGLLVRLAGGDESSFVGSPTDEAGSRAFGTGRACEESFTAFAAHERIAAAHGSAPLVV